MNFHDFLQTVPEFDVMSSEDIETLEKVMVVRDYPDGHEFIHEDANGQDIFLLIDGTVAVRHHRLHNRGFLNMKSVHPGELFGLLSLIDDKKCEASCKAVGTVKAASLPRPAFKLLYESNSPLARHFQYIVSRQLMRDYRNLIEFLRAVIFADNEEDANNAIESLLHDYHGTERRHAQRRKTNDAAAQ
jgi:CRP-like cAMP-binding protein